jgi:hypothetical protein
MIMELRLLQSNQINTNFDHDQSSEGKKTDI